MGLLRCEKLTSLCYNRPMQITLIRHGETDWNLDGRLMGRKDIPLNTHGREQAKILSEKLKTTPFVRCYTSPLSRAKETAEIICDGKCEIICDDNLMERSGGDLEGKVINNWGDYLKNATTETDSAILARAKNFLDTLRADNAKTAKILVVSHNGLLKNLRHLLENRPGPVDYTKNNLKNCDIETYEL